MFSTYLKFLFSSNLRKKKKHNRILWDTYQKNIEASILNEFQKSLHTFYKWLYTHGILKEISFIYKIKNNGVSFALDIDLLTPFFPSMVCADLPDIENIVEYLFDKSKNHRFVLANSYT